MYMYNHLNHYSILCSVVNMVSDIYLLNYLIRRIYHRTIDQYILQKYLLCQQLCQMEDVNYHLHI